LYFLASQCLETTFQRRWATALVAFGSGLGWIPYVGSYALAVVYPNAIGPGTQWVGGALFPQTIFPLSIDLAGITPFAYLINTPHFMLASAFAMLKYGLLIRGETNDSRWDFVWSGLCASVEANLRPYVMPETCLVFAAMFVASTLRDRAITRRRIGNYLWAGAMLAPTILYYGILYLTNVLGISGWERKSLHFTGYLAWFGLPMILGVLGFSGLARYRMMKPASVLLVIWILVAVLLAQAYPLLTFGEETVFGALSTVPSILIVAGILRQIGLALKHRYGIHSRRRAIQAAIAFVLVCSISNGIIYTRFFTLLRGSPAPYYVPTSLLEAFAWLDTNAGPDDAILLHPDYSPYVSRYTHSRVFVGNDLLTANYWEKVDKLWRFYVWPGDDEFKRALCQKYGIDYVIFGEWEGTAGGADASDHPWLTEVVRYGDTAVYATSAGRAM
jgi:hypothetical protein